MVGQSGKMNEKRNRIENLKWEKKITLMYATEIPISEACRSLHCDKT